MDSNKSAKRHAAILDCIRDNGAISVKGLARMFKVSDETIRRDAKALAGLGTAIKTHGMLSLPHLSGEMPFERRLRENANLKRIIAKRACELVEDGDSLMIDAGTTTSIFAQELRRKRRLTIVTNSSDIARTLATVNGNLVYMAGGALKGENGAAFGPPAVEFFARFRVKHTFISVAALNAVDGIMDEELEEANIARMALSRADHRILLSDSSKFGKSALVKISALTEINRLVTNASPDATLLTALEEANVTLTLALGQ